MTSVVQKYHWTGVVVDLKSNTDGADTMQYFLKVSQATIMHCRTVGTLKIRSTVRDKNACTVRPVSVLHFTVYGSLRTILCLLLVLQFGEQKLDTLPDFIMDSIHIVLYSLLANPQLSIREHVTIAFSSILSRCEFQVS